MTSSTLEKPNTKIKVKLQETTKTRKEANATAALPLLGHVKREFKEIDKDDLVLPVDHYQRNEADGKIANEIAANYNPVAFGALIVIASVTGELRVADGGTRWNAAKKRKDLRLLPCLVFRGLTLQQEADCFLVINENRRKLQVSQLQYAELAAQRELALTANSYLDRMGKAYVGFNSLRDLRTNIKSRPGSTKTIVTLLIDCASGKYVSSRVFKGMVMLETLLNRDANTLMKKASIIRREFDNLDVAVSTLVTDRRRTDGRTLALAIARRLRIHMPKG